MTLRMSIDIEKKSEKGLTEEIVRMISAEKNELEWMLDKRLEALKIFRQSKNRSGDLI